MVGLARRTEDVKGKGQTVSGIQLETQGDTLEDEARGWSLRLDIESPTLRNT
jgi:hypothetical protein